MMRTLSRIAVVSLVCVAMMSVACRQDIERRVEVFHKNKAPSLRTLERTKRVLQKYEDDCEVDYYLITAPENAALIRMYDLPETHFPFAVVIDGKYTASLDGRTVHFLEFPVFMKGIGRHEGDWSMDDLDRVLGDPSLLLEENLLPESFSHHHDEPCPGELE